MPTITFPRMPAFLFFEKYNIKCILARFAFFERPRDLQSDLLKQTPGLQPRRLCTQSDSDPKMLTAPLGAKLERPLLYADPQSGTSKALTGRNLTRAQREKINPKTGLTTYHKPCLK